MLTPFILITLLFEILFAIACSAYVKSWTAFVVMYLLFALIAYGRASWVLNKFKPTVNASLFAIIMVFQTAICSLMAILVGFVAISVSSEWFWLLENGLASTYYFAYNLEMYLAIGLTVAELFSLFVHRLIGRDSEMGNSMVNLVGYWRSSESFLVVRSDKGPL